MDKTSLYIQKLIALILVFFAGVLLFIKIPEIYLIPVLFLSFGYLTSRITAEKPLYLWGMTKSDEFMNKKAGFWVLFKWILSLFGFVYDLIVWTLFGIYILYSIIIDILLLIKTILYWLFHALIWFLTLFVPPLVFLYEMFIYYLIRWNWMIYKLSFRNIKYCANSNFYIISLWGAVAGIFVFMLFFGVGLLINAPSISVLGIVFGLLPVVWSFGEISYLRHRNREESDYHSVKNDFRSGFESVRAVLFYFIVFIVLIFIEIIFNLLGWIPQAGFSFLGLALNVNTLASLILLFILVILVFAGFILPPFVVSEGHRNNLNGSIIFLGIIGKKFLRYISVLIPSALFTGLVSFIPAVIVFISVIITQNVKNNIIDSRISILKERQTILKGIDRYKSSKNIDRLIFYKNYPQNCINKLSDIKELKFRIDDLKEKQIYTTDETSKLETQYINGIDSVKNALAKMGSKEKANDNERIEITGLENRLHDMTISYSTWKESSTEQINKIQVDLSDIKGMMIQLPIVFLLTIIWISVFGGLVLAVILAYLGNVYFELYGLKEDGKPTYCQQIISEQNQKNHNQPLLGFTLLLILVIILFFLPVIKEVNWDSLFR